ncbi:MAG: polymer-forming cytoskeletal protein [Candidatus Saccharibacteria bacterium]
MLNKKSPFDYRQAAGFYFSNLVKVEGTINEHEDIVIDSEYNGSIITNGFCEVSENGHVIGDIRARAITILGRTEGEFTARDSIVVKKSAKIKGHYYSPKILIESGSEVDARIKRHRAQKDELPS